MRVLVIGEADRLDEFSATAPEGWTCDTTEDWYMPAQEWLGYDLVAHLNFDDLAEGLETYLTLGGPVLLASAVKRTLAEAVYLAAEEPAAPLIGINPLPGFLSRRTWEVSTLHDDDWAIARQVLELTGKTLVRVPDRPGMVSARVLAMIVNEAYYMLGEQAAEATAIDQALKLGVNYPAGPLEWAERMGPHHLADLLMALREYYGDAYTPAPALMDRYFRTLEVG